MKLIEAKEITKIYPLGEVELRALDGVSIAIEEKEFVAIMGQSGSGKSTFMNIIGCLDIPTAGEYILEGINVGKLSRDELASIRNEKIGFVFQGFNLPSRTSALENVELPMLYNGVPAKERKDKALSALQRVGLEGRQHHHPNQVIGRTTAEGSYCRAIVNNVPIILADEPIGNLDTHTSVEIMELFEKLNQESNITVILMTLEPDIAAYNNRVVRFLDGKVVSDERKVRSS